MRKNIKKEKITMKKQNKNKNFKVSPLEKNLEKYKPF